jgi:hypothetical protein
MAKASRTPEPVIAAPAPAEISTPETVSTREPVNAPAPASTPEPDNAPAPVSSPEPVKAPAPVSTPEPNTKKPVDVTPDREKRDGASTAVLQQSAEGKLNIVDTGASVVAWGNVDVSKCDAQQNNCLDGPRDPTTPRSARALTADAASSLLHNVLLAVVCLSDFARSFNRGVLKGVDTKGREWQLFTLFLTLPSGELGKVMYWGDLAAEAKAAVGKAIHVYTATQCTRMAFLFKHSAESVANTFDFAGPSGYQGEIVAAPYTFSDRLHNLPYTLLQSLISIGDRAAVQLTAKRKTAGMLPMPETVVWRLDDYYYIDAKTGGHISHPYLWGEEPLAMVKQEAGEEFSLPLPC